MLKSVLKLVYIVFGAVMCVIIYSLSYTTNVQNKIRSTVNSCVKSGDRLEVARVFSMSLLPVDSVPVYESNIEGVGEIVIYNTVSQMRITTYENEGTEEKPDWNSTEETEYENMYYMFIFNPLFTYTSGGDKNYSGIRFYGDDNYIDYHFVVSTEEGDPNYDEYIKRPETKFQSIYNSKRDLIDNYDEFDFIFIPFTETLIEETTNYLGCSKIAKVGIVSHDINTNLDKVVTEINEDFDFSQQFYLDIAEYVDKRNVAMNGDSSDVKKDAKNFIKDFEVTDLNPNYVFGYSNSKIYTKSLIWNAIGIVCLFIVVLILVYFLIFHFQFIKGIIFRQPKSKQRFVPNKINNKKTADGRIDVNVKPEKQISSAHTKRKEAAIDAKVEEIKTDNVEESKNNSSNEESNNNETN